MCCVISPASSSIVFVLHMQKSNIPIVAILGSVDHGKSSLLDSIRKTNTIDDEAGEITQHIWGSYGRKR